VRQWRHGELAFAPRLAHTRPLRPSAPVVAIQLGGLPFRGHGRARLVRRSRRGQPHCC
jgi:hypothetical protein